MIPIFLKQELDKKVADIGVSSRDYYRAMLKSSMEAKNLYQEGNAGIIPLNEEAIAITEQFETPLKKVLMEGRMNPEAWTAFREVIREQLKEFHGYPEFSEGKIINMVSQVIPKMASKSGAFSPSKEEVEKAIEIIAEEMGIPGASQDVIEGNTTPSVRKLLGTCVMALSTSLVRGGFGVTASFTILFMIFHVIIHIIYKTVTTFSLPAWKDVLRIALRWVGDPLSMIREDVISDLQSEDRLEEDRLEERVLPPEAWTAFRKAVRDVVSSEPLNGSEAEIKRELKSKLPDIINFSRKISDRPTTAEIKEGIRIILDEIGASDSTRRYLLESKEGQSLDEVAVDFLEILQVIGSALKAAAKGGWEAYYKDVSSWTNKVSALIWGSTKTSIVVAEWFPVVIGGAICLYLMKLLFWDYLYDASEWVKRVFWDKIVKVDTHRATPDPKLKDKYVYAYLDPGREYRFTKNFTVYDISSPTNPVKVLHEGIPFKFHSFISLNWGQHPPYYIWIKPIAGPLKYGDYFVEMTALDYIENLDGSRIKS